MMPAADPPYWHRNIVALSQRGWDAHRIATTMRVTDEGVRRVLAKDDVPPSDRHRPSAVTEALLLEVLERHAPGMAPLDAIRRHLFAAESHAAWLAIIRIAVMGLRLRGIRIKNHNRQGYSLKEEE